MLLAVGMAVLLADLTRPPASQLSARVLLAAIELYQEAVPKPRAAQCRLVPSCSRYAAEVVRRFGAGKGGILTVRRLARCGPWTPIETADPPPERKPDEP